MALWSNINVGTKWIFIRSLFKLLARQSTIHRELGACGQGASSPLAIINADEVFANMSSYVQYQKRNSINIPIYNSKRKPHWVTTIPQSPIAYLSHVGISMDQVQPADLCGRVLDLFLVFKSRARKGQNQTFVPEYRIIFDIGMYKMVICQYVHLTAQPPGCIPLAVRVQ